jgi:hypothetical protein
LSTPQQHHINTFQKAKIIVLKTFLTFRVAFRGRNERSGQKKHHKSKKAGTWQPGEGEGSGDARRKKAEPTDDQGEAPEPNRAVMIRLTKEAGKERPDHE